MSNEKRAIYTCPTCGNVLESLWTGGADLVCCGTPMQKLVAGTVDASKEKHIPVIERVGDTVTVTVGSVAHPMTPEHYILFIELIAGDKVLRHEFKEGDTVATAVFNVPLGVAVSAREYCNLHGLWAA